jgi:hypothetical protein
MLSRLATSAAQAVAVNAHLPSLMTPSNARISSVDR